MSQSKPLQPWRNRPNPYSGTPGPQGPPGEDGARWHSVSATPAGSLGGVGDWALNASTGQVWQKTGSATWTSRGSLRGPQGVQGDTGPAGTITGATATGLAAGASPTVTLGGTASARTFAFGIPKGDKGDKGEKGDTGATGAKGDQGDTGPAGTAATLSVGSTTTGAPGTDASVTQSGTPQARTFNFTIPRGATGAKGDKGDPGGAGILGGAKIYEPSDRTRSIPNSNWTWIYLHSAAVDLPDVTLPWSSTTGYTPRVLSTGLWMVGASLAWSSNATGRRVMAVETWTGTDPGVNSGETIILSEAATGPGGRIVINGQTIVNLEANTNVRLLGWQNSGGALSTYSLGPTELWLTRIL